MRFGRLVLNRLQRGTGVPVPSGRILTLIVGREGAPTTGTMTYPRTATITHTQTAAIVRGFTSTATVPNRTTTAVDLWLTSP